MKDSRKLDLVSRYMNQPVLRAHTIGLELAESRPGTLEGAVRLDPNHCGLDLWGDPGACTKMAIFTRGAVATRMRTLDPLGHQRVHYAMEIKDMSDVRAHLIEYPRANLWYLTVVTEQEGTSVVPLFDAAWFGLDAVGTVQTRYGVPLREVMRRGDVNEMRAEAEAVRRALAELDGEAPAPGRVLRVDPGHVEEVRGALADLEAALRKLEG